MLAVRSISAAYGSVNILFDVSLTLEPSSCVALLGANGAGKTTLLKTISGFLVPCAGAIELDGVSIAGLPPHVIVAKGISQVLQGRQVIATMSVLDNLKLGAHLLSKRAKVASNEILLEVYALFPILSERAHALAGSLSGGEQQMLAVGRALMSRPDVLLLDEPTMGLAPMVIRQLLEAMKAIKARGIAMLLVEPNPELAFELADRCCLIDSGRVVLNDTTENMKKRTDIGKLYLGAHAG
jgi:branched-chain amino acid transport system ATP-binding protein